MCLANLLRPTISKNNIIPRIVRANAPIFPINSASSGLSDLGLIFLTIVFFKNPAAIKNRINIPKPTPKSIKSEEYLVIMVSNFSIL